MTTISVRHRSGQMRQKKVPACVRVDRKKQLKAPISLAISGDRPFFCVLIPDSTITPGQWSVMWPNCEQLGVVKPDKVSGCDGSPPAAGPGAANSCVAALVSQKPDHADVFCLLCSLLLPRCIRIPGGSYRRRCAEPQTLTAALFRRRVADREEDAHCDRHKLSIVPPGVKRRAPLLFELSRPEWSLLERERKGGS